MEVTGRIKFIGQQQFVTPTFSKRELVVTTEEQYPQHILIEFTQDKCALLDNFQIAEPVRVSINLRGREWVNPQGETKYFNSIQGWRIEKNQQQAYGQPQGQDPMAGNQMSQNSFTPPREFTSQNYGNQAPQKDSFEPYKGSFDEGDNDDLPF